MKQNRPKFLGFIATLTIFGGVIGAIRSLPVSTLLTTIKQGGLTVEDKVRVVEVQPNSPAQAAELKVGDVILSVNNQNIANSLEFIEITNGHKGIEITISIERDQQTRNVQLSPLINPPPNKGRVGVLLSDTKVGKTPIYRLIPQALSSTQVSRLAISLIILVTGIGLWKLKQWALIAIVITTFFALVSSLPFLTNPHNYRLLESQSLFSPQLNAPSLVDTVAYLLSVVIDITFGLYLYSQRKLFH